MDNGFIDLRQNRSDSGLDGNFWPSFTDIMTVIVMIFIITSTVLIMRNWELVSELRSTLSAERAARAEIAQAHHTSQSLEAQLAQVQSDLSQLRIRNLQLSEITEEQRRKLTEQLEKLLAMTTERDRLSEELQSVNRQASLAGDQLSQTQTRLQQLEQDYNVRGQRLEELLAALAQLEQRYRTSLSELGTLRQQRAAAESRLSALQSDYTNLDAKYQELIRPARSAEGRQVVEVRYSRNGASAQVQLRAPGENEFSTFNTEDMHRRLETLKQVYGKDLYVKIIIPEDSSLSYTEAWDFTRDVLKRYDYYYQE